MNRPGIGNELEAAACNPEVKMLFFAERPTVQDLIGKLLQANFANKLNFDSLLCAPFQGSQHVVHCSCSTVLSGRRERPEFSWCLDPVMESDQLHIYC